MGTKLILQRLASASRCCFKVKEFGSTVAYDEVLFHSRLLLCEFLVHFEKAGDDVGFGSVFGEAIGLQDGGIIGTMGLDQFGRHRVLSI